MEERTERENEILQKVCDTLARGMRKKPKQLLDRLDHNELAEKSALVGAAKLWRKRDKPPNEEATGEADDDEAALGFENRKNKLLDVVYGTMDAEKKVVKGRRRNAITPAIQIQGTGGDGGSSTKGNGKAVIGIAHKWRRNKLSKLNTGDDNGEGGMIAGYVRRATLRKNMLIQPIDVEEEKRKRKEAALRRFKSMVKRVCILAHVFRQMRNYAIEKGQHMRGLNSVISENEESGRIEKDLMFNQDTFKNKYQFCIPNWAYHICSLKPEDRTDADVMNLVHLMQPLKSFRKYSQKKQKLLAKIVRYESFGRRRVVIRKGHIGMSFYLIYSGTVAIVIQGDEDKAFSNDSAPANIMKRGDSFGELALVKAAARSATVVCTEKTEFFVIDKDAFFKLGMLELYYVPFPRSFSLGVIIFNVRQSDNTEGF